MNGLLHTFHEPFEISELLQQRLVGQKLDVLVVVECPIGRAALVHFLTVVWFVRIDTL